MLDMEGLYRGLNEGILLERGKSFGRNLEKNLGLIRLHGGLKSVIPLFEGKNVIVLGAGPSLWGNIGLLRKYQHRDEIVLLAVDMALRPLVKSGIRPRFVISCETRPAGFFHGIDTSGMHLLAFSCMSNINLRHWRGKISFYNWMISSPVYEKLWERAGKGLGSVATSSIVTTQAVSIALGCGIASLVLVGNDLGFDSECHARESVWHAGYLLSRSRFANPESEEMRFSRRRREYRIQRGGRVFFTDSQFLAAKTWMEELFQKQGRAVYDCSDPGCSGTHVVKISFSDAMRTVLSIKKRRSG